MRAARSLLTAPAAALAATAAAAAAALAALAPTADAATATAAPTPTCKEPAVSVSATATRRSEVLHIKVTNKTARACVVDRIPTVTFGDLDGAAQPVPPTSSAPYRLAAGATAHAAVRTVDPAGGTRPRIVDFVTVAADPSHRGRTIDADALDLPRGVAVWEPVTTWWQPSWAQADIALKAATH
ncbi:DUF4232 domain-containing protein [Streptomyces sp. NPDC058989]|uniref:DUF4232 domain-containing protein n=1 Tax=Streptomyces sp. NPDC058989 TaxID=3346686 RepID=UPI00367CB9DF